MPTSFPGSSPSRSLEREREREGEDPGNEVGLMRKHWKQVNVDRTSTCQRVNVSTSTCQRVASTCQRVNKSTWMQMNDHVDLVIVIKSHNALCLIDAMR